MAISLSIALKSSTLRQMTKDYVIDLIQKESGYELQIEDIYLSLSFPMNAYIPSAVISDTEGRIASINGLEVNIWPSIYMLKEINITNISASNLTIYRFPRSMSSPAITPSDATLAKLHDSTQQELVMQGQDSTMVYEKDKLALIPDIIIHKVMIDRIEIFDSENKLVSDTSSINGSNGSNNGSDIAINPLVSLAPIIAFDFTSNANLLFSKQSLEINVVSKLLDHIVSENLDLESQISLNAAIDLKEAKLNLTKADFVLLARDIEGEDITLNATLNGFLDESGGGLKGDIKLSKKDDKLLFDLYHFPDLKLEAKFNNLEGDIRGSIVLEQGNFAGASDFTFKNNVITLPNLHFNSQLSSKQVSMIYDLDKKILSADVKFKTSDLKDLQEFLPHLENGKIDLNAKYNLEFDKEIYAMKLDGSLDDFSYKLLHLEHVEAKANFTNLIALEFDNLEVSGKFINYDGMLVSKAKIKAIDNNITSIAKPPSKQASVQSGSNTLVEEVQEDPNWFDFDLNKSINIQTDIEIASPYPVTISSNKNLALSRNKIGLEVRSLNGYLNQTSIDLKKPILIDLAKELSISAPSIGFGKGQLSLSVNTHNLQNEKLLKGNAKFSNISLYDVFKGGIGHAFNNSKTNGQLTIGGSLSDPVIESKIDISNISLVTIQESLDDDKSDLESDSSNANASRALDKIKSSKRVSKGLIDKLSSDKSLKISTVATRNKLTSSAFINAGSKSIASLKLDIPILIDLPKGDFEIYQDKEVNIDFKVVDRLELLSLIPTPPGHNIRGIVEGGFKAGGNLNNLHLSGNMQLSEGKYSYKPLGIRIIDISSKIVASRQVLKLSNIYMADKFGNKITGSGIIDIEEDFPYKIDLVTEKFELLNSPHLQGSIAGKANLVGNKDSAKLFGNLFIGPMEIKIPTTIQQGFPELNVTEIIEVDHFSDKEGRESKKSKDEYQICFDVNIETYDHVKHKVEKRLRKSGEKPKGDSAEQDAYITNSVANTATAQPNMNSSTNLNLETPDLNNIQNKMVFVRGWGVDTRLQGGLKITGCSEKLLINGKLSAVDGKYSEFGRDLDIERGVLKFEGAIPPSPFLDIVGIVKEDNKEFRVSLGGPITSPQISISANPAMEEEEALSMILFGNNPDNISAFQAFQLASSVRRLSGGGDSIDILGASKKAIGIDEISFRNSSKDPENSSVAIGKHLSDKFYIEIEQGIEEDTKTKIEVEISPKVTVEAFTESTGNSSVGINWKYDY